MSIPIQPGDVLPLVVYWADTARNDLVVRAQVYVRGAATPIYSNVLLSYVPTSLAVYANMTNIMPAEDIVDVRYDVFDSNGTTLLGIAEEIFISSDDGSGSAVLQPSPIFGTVRSLSTIKGTVTCEGG